MAPVSVFGQILDQLCVAIIRDTKWEHLGVWVIIWPLDFVTNQLNDSFFVTGVSICQNKDSFLNVLFNFGIEGVVGWPKENGSS